MFRKSLLACLVAGFGFAAPVAAQEQTLADIRQEMSVLFVEIQKLKRELSTTGTPGISFGGDTLQRLDLIESELARLTSKTERLEFRINQVVADGTNQIGDLEFRLCELEPNCDIASLGDTPTLGGESATPVAPVRPAPANGNETQLAMGEQADFDRAKAALDQGSFRSAADLFEAFTSTYTGGPLTGQAHYYRGQALAGLGETSGAARSYLNSFSGDPQGALAPDALYGLGESLGVLGQANEACVTLAEVGVRFPGSGTADRASVEMQRLGCR